MTGDIGFSAFLFGLPSGGRGRVITETGIDKLVVELLVAADVLPEHTFPLEAAFVQHALGWQVELNHIGEQASDVQLPKAVVGHPVDSAGHYALSPIGLADPETNFRAVAVHIKLFDHANLTYGLLVVGNDKARIDLIFLDVLYPLACHIKRVGTGKTFPLVDSNLGVVSIAGEPGGVTVQKVTNAKIVVQVLFHSNVDFVFGFQVCIGTMWQR